MKNTTTFKQVRDYENIVYEMATISFSPRCVKHTAYDLMPYRTGVLPLSWDYFSVI